ncbi:hypothetical protein GCM10007170_46820 [Arthrobacter liuii]|uniref:SnoaL-like domain-containing protein n=1 Tax=Arthrobacter liuii TaxID=1476996 RepID=A0ABQ2B3K0_9MICC|nr:hypothetical protein GCM10007170_46820 [Arthrobacter liuii]
MNGVARIRCGMLAAVLLLEAAAAGCRKLSTGSRARNTFKPSHDPTRMMERSPIMGTTENVDLVRRGYEAFNAGDMTSLSEMFAEHAELSDD